MQTLSREPYCPVCGFRGTTVGSKCPKCSLSVLFNPNAFINQDHYPGSYNLTRTTLKGRMSTNRIPLEG